MAQGPGKSRVTLEGSESSGFEKTKDGKIVYKFRKGVFRQDYSTLTGDSSKFYADDNLVDSYGHVVINQGDTLHIFSDKLHYDGNTKLATLTGNVKLVDKDATLTTDYFTYNTATRIGTYTGGGKLFNKENTLTSKTGYYFANSRDAYFRYDVVFNTPDAIIKTDTLRYNSGSRISWFYGPTNIYGTKDKDVLYTENGRYETIPEQAFFGKKNLYTQGSKSLKGDSLFYDRLKGYGRAVKNVVFDDKEQRATVKGHLGEYYKATETAIITQNPYVIFVTQDSSKANTAPLKTDPPVKVDNSDPLLTVKKDTVTQKIITPNPVTPVVSNPQSKKSAPEQTVAAAAAVAGNKPTLKGVTDSVMKAAQQSANRQANMSAIIPKAVPQAGQLKDSVSQQSTAKVDSMYMGADTIITRVITVKEEREMKLARYLLDNPDTAAARRPKSIPLTKATLPKVLKITPPPFPAVTSFIHPDFFGAPAKPEPKPVAKAAPPKDPPVTKTAPTKAKTAASAAKTDSTALKAKTLSDTSRIRIIIGYHGAKIFKSDLQAKADSMYYSSSDSIIRSYVNPIIWTQGSQLTGDTITLQMKNRKLDNIDLFPNGFIVNIEKNDSLHFNQAGGRKIHGTFKDSRLNSIEITGNAESIYFNRDTVKNVVTEMVRSASNTAKATFKNGRLNRANTYGNTENKINPLGKVKDDDKILKAFIWKPKERPQSKEDIIGGKQAPPATAVKPPDTKKPGGPATAEDKNGGKNAPPNTPANKPGTPAPIKENAPPKPVTYDVIISN